MPPLNIGANTSDFSYAASDDQAPATNQPPVTGSYGGLMLNVVDSADSLADAAEELSVSVAEDDAQEINDDGPEVKEDRDDFYDIEDPEKIPEYLDKAGLSDNAGKALLHADLLSGRLPNVRERLAQTHADDPTSQYLAVQDALTSALANKAKGGAAEPRQDAVIAQLRAVSADLQLESGSRIRADMNTIDVAGGAGQSASDVKTFQNGYQDVVLGKGTLSGTLQIVLGAFGGDDPGAALAKLTQALGRDLASSRPSVDTVRINALLNDQFQAATAISVLERCRTLPGAGDNPSPERAGQLMRAAVSCTAERWMGPPKFTTLAAQHGGTDSETQIAFMTGFRATLRDMPVQVFQDADHRDHALTVTQQAIDELIEAEE